MNTVITSKEAILETSRKLIQENGWAAVHIRSVAQGAISPAAAAIISWTANLT